MPLIQQALMSSSEFERKDRGNYFLKLYSREGLIRYVMCCSQSTLGGFRDKPGK